MIRTGRRPRPRIGLSTVAFGHGADIDADIDAFVAMGCEVVELCACDTASWRRVAPRIRSIGVPVGLHCPVPFDGKLTRFDITSSVRAERDTAFDLVERTLRAAEQSAASYVVVHFPSPCPRPVAGPTRTSWTADRREFVLWCGERLAVAQSRSGVPVLVENLSHHPVFGSADDYREFFRRYPNLRMCLDVGHAHVSAHNRDVYEFVAAVREFVGSVHLYNTEKSGERAGEHRTPRVDRGGADGWIDLCRVLNLLAGQPAPDQLVFEYHATRAAAQEQYDATKWLRQRALEMQWG